MLTNVQKKLNLFIVLMIVAMVTGAGLASAEPAYHYVGFPEFGWIAAVTDTGSLLVEYPPGASMVVEPARDAVGNPVWDADLDGIADGYTTFPLNHPGEYTVVMGLDLNVSLDAVGYGRRADGTDVALLWRDVSSDNPPVELGHLLGFPYSYRTVEAQCINDLGQVVIGEYGFGERYDFALSLVDPKDTTGDDVPDLWNEDINGDGCNDLLVPLQTSLHEGGFSGCLNCIWANINNSGEVVGRLIESSFEPDPGFVVLPEDTDDDGKPDLWFKDLDGDGWNDCSVDLVVSTQLGLSESGLIVGSAGGNRYRWQIVYDPDPAVVLVAVEATDVIFREVNDLGQSVGYTRYVQGRLDKHYKVQHTTYLWQPDLTVLNLYDLLDNPGKKEMNLAGVWINNAGVIAGVGDEAFIAVPIVANADPEVSINNPVDGTIFDSGVTIHFSGTAFDAEDGDLTANLVWTSNIDGPIGEGGDFSTTLSDGIHTITTSVTDSGGKTGSDSISITVGTGEPDVTVDSIAPDTVQAGATIEVTITGSGFQAGATVTFENGQGPAPVANVTPVDDTTIEAAVAAHKNAKTGVKWDVRVTNPDGSFDVLLGRFTVTP